MSNSWLSNSNSPGFVYFDIDTTPSKEKINTESSDFIAFSDSSPSPQINRFSPNNYSSPQNFRRGSPRNFFRRGWKPNYNKSYSPNTSYNSTTHSPRNRSRDSSYHSFKSVNESFNKVTYSSFLEDPWAILERQLEEKRQSESNKLEDSSDSLDYDTAQKNEQVT